LVATGTRPAIPPVEGLDQVPFLTSDLLTWGEEQELRELPRSLVIVGGGYIALELGQMFHRFGVEVTILERSRDPLPREEPEVGATVVELLRAEGIQVSTEAAVCRVAPDPAGVRVFADIRGRSRELQAERLLVATGRRPNTNGIGLEAVDVRTDEAGWVVVDATLRTSASHVYAAGDVIGAYAESQLATPVGAHDGAIAAENALTSAMRRVRHDVVPRTIFTDPQIATVGLTEADATARGHRCVCRTVSMAHVPRAGAVRDPRGIVKMVADAETAKVLGVTMLGRDAGEVIHEAAMGLRFGASVRDFAELIHVYPTMAEALKIVALAFSTDVAKLSCCAEG
jgi:mercuric reductase